MISIKMRVKELCSEKNMSVKQLSDVSGVPGSTIRSILTTKKDMNVRIETIEKMAKGFGISLMEFFDSDIFK